MDYKKTRFIQPYNPTVTSRTTERWGILIRETNWKLKKRIEQYLMTSFFVEFPNYGLFHFFHLQSIRGCNNNNNKHNFFNE